MKNSTILYLAGMVGVSYFGLTILLLSLFDPEFNPVSQLASDYGVGRYAVEMNVGFFIGGIGMCSFALGYFLEKIRRSFAGSVILFLDGLVLVMDSYFTTNVEGAPATLHGTIHGFGGAIFFFTAPFGIILVARKMSRPRVWATLPAVIAGVAFEFVNALLSLDAGGLAERILLLVIFGAVITDAWVMYRKSITGSTLPGQTQPS